MKLTKSSIMKKLLPLLLLFAGMANAQVINIPDANFKARLLAADTSNTIATDLLDNATKIDANNDGNISVSEAIAIKSLNIAGSEIADMTGISEFTGLQAVYCQNNHLTSLDISNLSSMIVLICSNNQMVSLDVNGLSNLQTLQCDNNELTSINLSGLTGLVGLACNFNQLTSLDMSGLNFLENVNCSNNQLTSISVDTVLHLISLDCSSNLLTTFSASNLQFFNTLTCTNNNLAFLNLTGLLPNFRALDCTGNQLTFLDLTELTFLQKLTCSNNQLSFINTTGLSNLQEYFCDRNMLSTLDASGLPALTYLSCASNQLTSLSINGLSNLRYLQCGYNQLASINLNGLTSILQIDCRFNFLTALDVNSLVTLQFLFCNHNLLPTINVTGITNLRWFICQENLLPALDVNGLTNLELLWCDYNQLTSLDVSTLLNLEQLLCGHNQLPELNVSGLMALKNLSCPFNLLPSLNVTGLTNLESLICNDNQIPALDITSLTALTLLECSNNMIPALNLSGSANLVHLKCDANQITSLDLTGLSALRWLECTNNQLTTLDASICTNLDLGLNCSNNLLTTLFVKNGLNEPITFSNNPALQYICGDESQIANLQSAAITNNPSTVVSSYCSFTPGGNYNTVAGTAHYDLNNNGCDGTDVVPVSLRFDLTDGNISSGTFLNNAGGYTLYAGIGNYTLNAHLENPDYFTVTPPSTTHQFPALDNTVVNQDFCLAANGAHRDVEVVFYPIENARPGFDTHYRILYKNKGNQTLSGTLNLIFDDARTDFVTADPVVENLAINSLTWNYADLLPFETRTIDLVLNINSPIEFPAVNAGNLLQFTASINPVAGDDLPEDNVFNLTQTVVSSFDPNDITCLEGENVPPTEIGKYLHYVARFENTGNHDAENVVVKLVIDTDKYDVNSLQLLNTSQPSYTVITGNKVEFFFKNIHLAPVTGDPPVGGHGTILFKIKTLQNLSAGDQVSNRANIFFDYNAPVETNPALTTFTLLSSPGFTKDESIVLYPNPTNGIIKINCDNSIKSIELYDLEGRIIETTLEHTKTTQLDISNRANGIYFVKVATQNGEQIQKIIKE
jgi:Leucine-rich repeat (LRR) protein